MKKLIIIFSLLTAFLFSSDRTVAFVGKTPVFESEVYQIIYTEKASFDKALERVIERKLIVEKAKKEDIEVKEEEINKEFERIKSSFPDEKSFMDNLKKSGITVAELKNILKEKVITRKFIEKEIIRKIEISTSEVANFMGKHSEITEYNFKFKWFESKEKADEFCISPDSNKMEESGYLKEDEILPEILENLKKLKKGMFSRPFKIGNKFIVVYLIDIKKEEVKDIKQLYQIARRKIYKEKFNTLYANLISRLKEEIPVIINK